MAYWDYERNDKNPDAVLESSIAYVHWVCQKDSSHRWMARVSDMAKDCKCPGCVAGADQYLPKKRKAKRGSILAETNPDVAREWHPTFNGSITPSDVNKGTTTKYWWVCSTHDIVWETSVSRRVRGSGCPLCLREKLHDANSKPLSGESLADKYPTFVESEWDFEENAISPYDLKPQSHQNVSWVCQVNKSHKWVTSPHNRINGNTKCPICSEWQHTSFPEKAIFFYVSKVFPDAIESYKPDIDAFGRKTLDIYIPSIRVAIEYDGQTWHGDKNRDVDKDCLCFTYGIRLIRVREPQCPKYNNSLSTTYIDRTDEKSAKSLDECIKDILAHICSDADVVVDTKSDEADIRRLVNCDMSNKSVAKKYPNLVNEWVVDSNDGLTLDSFRSSSNYVGTWICPKGHIYTMSIRHRCQGHGCRKCGLMKPRNGMPTLRDSYPLISDEWVHAMDGSTMTPDDVGRRSKLDVLWRCSHCGDVWTESVQRRTTRGDVPFCDNCRKPIKHAVHIETDDVVAPDKKQGTCSTDKPKRRKKRSGYKLSVERKMSDEGKEKLRKKHEKKFLDRLAVARPEIEVLSRYEGCDKPVLVRCKNCGKTKTVNPTSLFNAKKCSGCRGVERSVTHEEFVDRLTAANPNVVAVGEYTAANKKMTFRCLIHDVEWDALPQNVIRGCGCPQCKSEALSMAKHLNIEGRSLNDLYPKIANEWVHAVGNPNLDATMVTPGSSTVVLWKCGSCGYEWTTTVHARIREDGMPYCRSCRAKIRSEALSSREE